ncbi:hypothetical protein JHK82_050763 [Glycine max]|nr:hypothetical protein JHK82_050763 [Glycine max]
MVDMLSRAGHVEEAKKLIEEMPVEPNDVIWKTLLSACQNYENLSIGEPVGQQLTQLYSCSPSSYVLLSNIYASLGMWDNVKRVRTEMKEKQLKKIPGCSWIELGGIVHQFSVQDRTHSQVAEIYSLLSSFEAHSSFTLTQPSLLKMDSSLPEIAKDSIANTSYASTTKTPLPHHSKASSKRKTRSIAWDHFKEDSNEDYKVACNYCGTLIKFKGGPSAMKNHLLRCPDNPNKGQKVQRSIASSSQILEGQGNEIYKQKKFKEARDRNSRSIENICKFAKKGLTPSHIGVILHDSHGIAQVKSVTGSKILRILKAHRLAPEISKDLYHLIKKVVYIRKHLERNKKDKDSKFKLILVESRIHRLAHYYKKTKKLPPSQHGLSLVPSGNDCYALPMLMLIMDQYTMQEQNMAHID